MWQRFTERARKVVFYAQEEAQKYGEGYVSTEHLLLGLVREEDSVAARVLTLCGLSRDNVREEILQLLPRGNARPSQDMTLTPRAKRVIDLAYDEARNLNNNYIGTEHLLLGLVREEDGLAGKVLAHLGLDLEATRKTVMSIQDEETTTSNTTRRRTESNDLSSRDRIWQMLAIRKQRMAADQLCLMFLFEQNGRAQKAVAGCDGSISAVASLIEEEMLTAKSPKELTAGFLGVTDILVLAGVEACGMEQDLNGAHFLLAAMVHNDNATARALTDSEITYDQLKAWVAENP